MEADPLAPDAEQAPKVHKHDAATHAEEHGLVVEAVFALQEPVAIHAEELRGPADHVQVIQLDDVILHYRGLKGRYDDAGGGEGVVKEEVAFRGG